MESLHVILDLTNQDLGDGEYGEIVIAGKPRETEAGNPSVIIALAQPEGGLLVGETTLALFLTTADALKARHGDPRISRT